jgi:predicted RNA-binding protein YlxR (DUF448 family)
MSRETRIRTCGACGAKSPNTSALLRVGGPSGSPFVSEGRGAYVCLEKRCIDRAIDKKLFVRTLKTSAENIDWSQVGDQLNEILELADA